MLKTLLIVLVIVWLSCVNATHKIIARDNDNNVDSWIVVNKDLSYYRIADIRDISDDDENIAWIEQEVNFTIATYQCNSTWSLDRIALPNDNNYTFTEDGTNVHIYIVDSGIRLTHEQFEGRAQFGYDAFDENEMGDPNGHGTHVAGLAASNDFGTAKKSTIWGVRVVNAAGTATTSNVLQGLSWILNNGQRPAVINLSIIGPKTPVINAYIDLLYTNNFTVVAAAGNNNDDACDYSPVSASTAIGVGATDFNNYRATFSSYGSCLNLFAPGVNIESLSNLNDQATVIGSGTSMSAPLVSGIVALILGANPEYTPQQVWSTLQSFGIAGIVTNPGTGSPNLLLQTPYPDSDPDGCFNSNNNVSSASTRLRGLFK